MAMEGGKGAILCFGIFCAEKDLRMLYIVCACTMEYNEFKKTLLLVKSEIFHIHIY